MASKVAGQKLDSMAMTCERRALKKGLAISEAMSHPYNRHMRCCHQGGGLGYPLSKQIELVGHLFQLVLIIIIIIHSIYIAPFNDPRTHTRVKRQRGGDRG